MDLPSPQHPSSADSAGTHSVQGGSKAAGRIEFRSRCSGAEPPRHVRRHFSTSRSNRSHKLRPLEFADACVSNHR